MTLFIKKFLFFIIIPVVVVILILLVFIDYSNKLSIDYKIQPEISSIYIGDSHIQMAVNDNIVAGSLNVATTSESFYFSYYKLKMLLDNNPSIKNVYLGLSFHSLSAYNDRFISGDYSSVIASKYFCLLPKKEQFRMIYWNKDKLLTFIKKIIQQGGEKGFDKKKPSFIGGFKNQFIETKAVKSSMDKRLLFQYFNNEELYPFSELNINYLSKIVTLCKVNDVKIIGLNTPLNKYYYNKIPNEYKIKIKEVLLTNQLGYIDLSNFDLSDEYFIPDGDHVSYKGAEATSIKLNSNVSTGKVVD